MTRGTKRAATQQPVAQPEAKKVADFLRQQKITKASFQPVVEIVQHPLADLTEDCRQMLVSVLPWSLCVEADKRHVLQSRPVCMVQEVVESIKAKYQEAINAEIERVAELESKQNEIRTDLEKKEKVLAETNSSAEEHKSRLAELTSVLSAKKVALGQAEGEEKKCRADCERIEAMRQHVEKVLSGSFKKLRECDFEDSEAQLLVEEVTALATKLSLDESMLLALPTSLTKRERGPFDVVVIQQIDDDFSKRVSNLSEELSAAAALAEAQALTLQEAQAAVETAKSEVQLAASGLTSAQEARSDAASTMNLAQETLTHHNLSVKEAKSARETKEAEAELFHDYNVCAFDLLRDRATPEPPTAKETSTGEHKVPSDSSAEQPENATDEVACEPQNSADMIVEKVPHAIETPVTTVIAGGA